MRVTGDIRLGVVGYGHRGRGMLKLAVEAFDHIVPAAVCETTPALLDQARKDHPGALCFEEAGRMFAEATLNAVLIETPATHHAELGTAALRAGIHVMSDVPAVATLEQGTLLYEAAQQSSAIYMLGANPNFWGFIDTFAELKDRGLIGAPYYIEAAYIHDLRSYFASTPWRATYESIRYCTHSLGPVLRLLNEDLEWVSCFDTGSHVNRVPGQHDAMVALFRTRSNVTVRLLTSFINHYPKTSSGHHYRVFGTRGSVERTPDHNGGWRTLLHSCDLPTESRFTELPVGDMPPRYLGTSKAAGHGGADYAMFEAFFDAIRRRQPSPVGVREALRMTLPGVVAAESARRGGELLQIRYPWTSVE